MKQNLRMGVFTGVALGAMIVAGLIDEPRVQRPAETSAIAKMRMAGPTVPLMAGITLAHREHSTLADFIAPYRDCSVPAAANAIAVDPRCEGLSLSENGPLETNPH